MPLNPEAVGLAGEVRTTHWNSKDCLLYAVGIGAGQDDLTFTTENSIDIAQQVYPTFAVVAGVDNMSAGSRVFEHIGDFNPAMLVHGSQSITLHGPIPVSAHVTSQDRVVAMYDCVVARTPPNATRHCAFSKSAPMMVTSVPPDTTPVFGLIDVTVGAFSGAGVSS